MVWQGQGERIGKYRCAYSRLSSVHFAFRAEKQPARGVRSEAFYRGTDIAYFITYSKADFESIRNQGTNCEVWLGLIAISYVANRN
jgi:hypothetical protein